MGVDPLSSRSYLELQRQSEVEKAKGKEQGSLFAQKLEWAGNEELSPQQLQAQAMLKLAQLQLWDGLFFGDDDMPTADFLSGLSLARYPQPQVLQQQVERVYAQLQPSLRADGELKKSDIEKMIDQVAEKVSLAPELIHSVVAAESAFEPQAVSPAGAQGLMQLMPATARELGVEDSFDPEQNLLGGSTYLKRLLGKYHGDLDKALAAYNWGPGNVDRKGLAEMPEETRNYLAKVKGLLQQAA